MRLDFSGARTYFMLAICVVLPAGWNLEKLHFPRVPN